MDCENSRDIFAPLAPHIRTTIDSNFNSLITLIEDVPNPQAIYDDQVLVSHIMALGLVRNSAIGSIEFALNKTKKLHEEILVEMAD